jgi:hypothetical protein
MRANSPMAVKYRADCDIGILNAASGFPVVGESFESVSTMKRG